MKAKNLSSVSRLLLLSMALSALAPMTASAAAIQTVEDVTNPERAIKKRVELYGALRLSVDYSDSDVSGAEAKDESMLSNGDVSVSSNTSMIGFRGEIPYRDGYKFLWQFEQQVDIDDTDPGDVWTTRDSFLGIDTPAGTFLIGRVNTPFKNLGVSYLGYFNTTIGDSHAILGAPASGAGGRLDLLGANSLNWKFKVKDVSVAMQYSADQTGSINTVDDNDRDSYSAWLDWRPGPFQLGTAYIHYSDAFGTGSLDAYRVSGKYSVGAWTLGAIYEDIDTDGFAALSRKAYGAQAEWGFMPRWVAVAQWNHAQASDAGNDEADQYSAGLGHHLNEYVLVYGMYTLTENGKNASYRGVDYAHGDKLGTLPGRDPWSVSLGAQLKF